MTAHKKPWILRGARGTRKTLMALAFGAWVVYLGGRLFAWYFDGGGMQKIDDWLEGKK